MHPARKASSQKRRKIQDDVRLMFSGSSVSARQSPNSGTGPLSVVLFLVVLGMVMFGAKIYLAYNGQWQQYQSFKSFLTAVSQPEVEVASAVEVGFDNWQAIVEPVFNPQPRLDGDQMANFELVHTIPNDPAAYDLDKLGKYPLGYTPAMMEVLFANTLSESSYRHIDPVSGNLNTSSKGCVGLMQGCNDLCTPEEWAQIHTNVWCGAATFKWFWDQLDVDSNPMLVHYALAGYKGGFTSYDSDGDSVDDAWVRDPATGLPTINAEGEEGARVAQSYLVWIEKR